MEGIEKIKKKIMDDAQKQVDGIRKESEEEIRTIKDKQTKESKAYKTQYTERTKAMVELLKHKSLAQARLQAKKGLLETREEIITDLIAQAMKKPEKKTYTALLKKLVDGATPLLSGKIIMHFAKADKVEMKKLAGTAKLVEADIDGGIIFEDSKGKRIDKSLSALLEQSQTGIRQEVAKLLH